MSEGEERIEEERLRMEWALRTPYIRASLPSHSVDISAGIVLALALAGFDVAWPIALLAGVYVGVDLVTTFWGVHRTANQYAQDNRK